jgi:putative ABC transport system permease protein
VLFTFVILYVITVFLSASYPSIVLSAFRPVSVLYGKVSQQRGGLSIRKFVTVFQFSISIILITSGIIIQRQLYFIRHADTGIQRDNVVMIPFGLNVGKNYTAFKNDMQSLPAVQEVSAALHPLYKGYDMMGVKPKNAEQMILMPTLMVDQHFISLLKLRWKTPPGDSVFTSNRKEVAVVNETAVDKLNLGPQPIHQKVDNQFEVAGVLKDFNYTSLQNKIEPLCLFIVKDSDTSALWSHQGGYLYARLMANANIPSLIDQLKSIYEKYDREKPFEIRFMDEAFAAQYKAEDRLSKILSAFTAFAVLIASLGLFGLATFMAVQRTKEIGVRKVLGASVQSIALLLSKDFVKLVILAIVIASPIAWWTVNGWLQNFAYRAEIQWWMFVATGLLVVGIALLTVSYQAIKAAIANPVKSLRTE